MQTLRLTAKDFKKSDSSYSDYIGAEIESDADVNIEIEAHLGYVHFDRLNVKGSIVAETGMGIKAGEGIEAGWSIRAGEGIEAGLSISCKSTLKVAYRVFAGVCCWKEHLEDSEKIITCGKFEGGKVEYGILKETESLK